MGLDFGLPPSLMGLEGNGDGL